MFGSWMYDNSQLSLFPTTQAVNTNNYMKNVEWDLLSVSTERYGFGITDGKYLQHSTSQLCINFKFRHFNSIQYSK